MSSKVSKKNRFQLKKPELSERNQKLKEELAAAPPQRNVMEGFTKWRMITYVCIICLPPYGLYRIWSKESTFTLPERTVWTFIIIVYVMQLSRAFLFS